jgi:hypothetical protein
MTGSSQDRSEIWLKFGSDMFNTCPISSICVFCQIFGYVSLRDQGNQIRFGLRHTQHEPDNIQSHPVGLQYAQLHWPSKQAQLAAQPRFSKVSRARLVSSRVVTLEGAARAVATRSAKIAVNVFMMIVKLWKQVQN